MQFIQSEPLHGVITTRVHTDVCTYIHPVGESYRSRTSWAWWFIVKSRADRIQCQKSLLSGTVQMFHMLCKVILLKNGYVYTSCVPPHLHRCLLTGVKECWVTWNELQAVSWKLPGVGVGQRPESSAERYPVYLLSVRERIYINTDFQLVQLHFSTLALI